MGWKSRAAAESRGWSRVLNQGRLKSVMTYVVGYQLDMIKHYVKTPFYEVRYQDDQGNVYAKPEMEKYKTPSEAETFLKAQGYQKTGITVVSKTKKETPPPKLYDLATISGALASKGLTSKKMLKLYQKMYESTDNKGRRILSYPRTDDKFISKAQFEEMLPYVDAIADLVGVDKGYLSHREPRNTHIKENVTHGANRPGGNIPKSLKKLDEDFGKGAAMLYEFVAKNFLAMFAENYVYDATVLSTGPANEFIAKLATPVRRGWKNIFKDDEDDKDSIDKIPGTTADPFIFEGFNKKPEIPTVKWLQKQLERFNVGTGATRAGAIPEIVGAKLMEEKKGKLTLTKNGEISYQLLQGTYLSNAKITERLYVLMGEIKALKRPIMEVVQFVETVVKHDYPIMLENAKKLTQGTDEPYKEFVPKEKATGSDAAGNTIEFNKKYNDHEFSDEEIKQLLEGEEIEFDTVWKSGKEGSVLGALKLKTYKGKEFWAFTPSFDENYEKLKGPKD